MTTLTQPAYWSRSLVAAVDQAAARLLSTWPGISMAGPQDVRRKADGTLVSAADTDAEQILVKAITHLDPTGLIVTEEDPATHQANTNHRALTWYIDPLDGTRQYLDGSTDFAVLVSAWRGQAPEFSIASFPATGVLAVADRDQATFRPLPQPPDQRPVHACYFEPAALRERLSAGNPLLVDAFESTRALTEVARGTAAGAVAEMCGHRAWDIAALCHLLIATGRHITDEHGRPVRFDGPDVTARYLVAADTRELHSLLLTTLESTP
ncbi:inositol monophosphatase family protein [Kitasatospora sp. NPDC056783]|uniref:inositol monophosphatase family protein n=1 Tax=Kitasatospora sp. NPDC056783 TaxID=3345943 RepID=UPI003690B257